MIIHEVNSPNHDHRPPNARVDLVLLHYTGMRTAQEALDRLCDPAPPTGHPVSAHYLIEDDGTLWSIVPDSRRAWHAGVSRWRDATSLNDRSVGIEIVNPGHAFGYRDFPAAQMDAVRNVCQAVLRRWSIDPMNVIGHSDVAPTRKRDPGELFDWAWLARHGVGLWPSAWGSEPCASVNAELSAVGYETTQITAAIEAFQLHWRPARVDGIPDHETRCRIASIAEAFGRGARRQAPMSERKMPSGHLTRPVTA